MGVEDGIVVVDMVDEGLRSIIFLLEWLGIFRGMKGEDLIGKVFIFLIFFIVKV